MKKRLLVILAIAISLAATQLIAGGNGDPTGNVDRLAVCHKPGTPAEKTLHVPLTAVPGHWGHGDTLGECGGEVPESD